MTFQNIVEDIDEIHNELQNVIEDTNKLQMKENKFHCAIHKIVMYYQYKNTLSKEEFIKILRDESLIK